MSGGHWDSRHPVCDNIIFNPQLRRFGTEQLLPVYEQVGPNSSQSQDPLLLSKPVTPKEPNTPHETDRVIKTVALQGGGNAQNQVEITQESDQEQSDSSIQSDEEAKPEKESISVTSIDLQKESHGQPRDLKKRKTTNNTVESQSFKKFKFNIRH